MHCICTIDRDECKADKMICGLNALCKNTLGSFKCSCKAGYERPAGKNFCGGQWQRSIVRLDRHFLSQWCVFAYSRKLW